MTMDIPHIEQHESMTTLESAVVSAHEQLPEGAPEQEKREAIRDVVKEHVASALPSVTPPVNDATLPPMTEDERVILERELNVAFREGLATATAHIASHKNEPHLIDAFHDVLTDHFYDKLVSSGKLDPNA